MNGGVNDSTNCRRKKHAAFTLAECVVLLASVGMLFLIFFVIKTGGCRLKTKGARVRCTSNLKQVALSYALWSNDNEQGLPMEVPASKGGIREAAIAGDLLSAVHIASNQMRSPSILICPADKKRKPAQTFAKLTTVNISYFLNIDAATNNQNHIVAGDRNLAVAGSPVKPGLLQLTDADVSWTKDLHEYGGNVALVDGSVHQVTTKGLRDLLSLSPTNRLIVP